MSKKRILLVEDDKLNSGVIKVFLSAEYEVDHAENGQIALELAEKNNYDLFLMDINLGRGLNGLDVAQNLKQQDKYKNAPIVAITAYAMESDKREFLQKGCTHYLSKPFFKKDILAIIAKALADQNA
ncbi:MAG TPA: response regulator [Ignavibacteriaceae bacterium]|nr:response regulator [Ignavibacteriaceae bacterium]